MTECHIWKARSLDVQGRTNVYLSAHSPSLLPTSFPHCETAQLDVTPQGRWMYHQLTFLCSGIYQNPWVLIWCCWAQLITPHPSQLLSPPSLKGDWHWGEEWGELPVICNNISCSQPKLWSSKFSKSSFCLTQPCWGGNRHRESQQSSAAQKKQIPPLLIILGSLRGFFWEPLGIWSRSCHQAVNRAISCALWGKRPCALTGPSSPTGVVSTPPFSKFNPQISQASSVFPCSCPRPAAGHSWSQLWLSLLTRDWHSTGRCWWGCPFTSLCPYSKSRSISISAKVLIALLRTGYISGPWVSPLLTSPIKPKYKSLPLAASPSSLDLSSLLPLGTRQ